MLGTPLFVFEQKLPRDSCDTDLGYYPRGPTPLSDEETDPRLATLKHATEPFYSVHELTYEECPATFFVGVPTTEAPGVLQDPPRLATGRGFTRGVALGGCIGEIAETLCLCQTESSVLVRARASALDAPAVLPPQLAQYGIEQHVDRKRWNSRYGEHAWIPEPFDAERSIDWVRAQSLGGEVKYLPAACCYLDYFHASQDGRYAVADSNGCAVAWSPEEAVLRGFLELVERDATGIWWYGMHSRPAVAIEQLEDEHLRQLQNWHRGTGRSFAVLDLTTDLEIPVCVAVSADEQGANVSLGFAAALDMGRAVSAACAEMLQLELSMSLIARARDEEPATKTRHTKMMDTWLKRANFKRVPHLVAAGGERTVPDPVPVMEGSPADLIAWCEERCRQMGLSLWVLDSSRPELPVHAARVVVPGLCHYKAQLGVRRLYEVPLALGWSSRPLREEDLSSLPLLI